jgi:hypothetical protein
MEVGATISLDTAHAYMTLHPWAKNPTEEAKSYQYWLNAMLTLGQNQVSGQTRLIAPRSRVAVHSTGDESLPGPGASMTWPIYGGRDLSWYHTWRAHLGFFIPGPVGFTGLYDYEADQGIVRALPTPGWPAGSKFFGPAGLPPAIWTDDQSTYLELWSGATGSFSSQAILDPGESVGWTEQWYPVSGMQGYDYANPNAALRLTETASSVEVAVAVSAITAGQVKLAANEQVIASWEVTLSPGQAFRTTKKRPEGDTGPLTLSLYNTAGALLAQTHQ